MRYLFILSLLSLAACARPNQEIDPRTISGIDDTFTPYINAYIQFKGKAIAYDIPMQFNNLDGSVVGVCKRWSTGERQIEIDPAKWDMLDEGARYETIFHELGHCDLSREHIVDLVNNQPLSIMYPYVFSLYNSTLSYYINELFAPTTHIFNKLQTLNLPCVVDIQVE